jgi:hypothetical protein
MIQANVAWDFGHRPTLGEDARQSQPKSRLGHPGVESDGPAFLYTAGCCARAPMEVRPR